MKEEPKRKILILSFALAVLAMTVVTLAIGYLERQIYYLSEYWNPLKFFFYLAAFALIFAFLHDFLSRDIELSFKRRLFLALGLLIASTVIAQSIWIIVTPRWAFSVSTDKSSYGLGESVRITASLKNLGFVTHSIRSGISDPIVIGIEYQYNNLYPTATYQVWYSQINKNSVEFSIGPGQSLERDFIWNQTKIINIHREGTEIQPGRYYVTAGVYDVDRGFGSPLFYAWTSINITA